MLFSIRRFQLIFCILIIVSPNSTFSDSNDTSSPSTTPSTLSTTSASPLSPSQPTTSPSNLLPKFPNIGFLGRGYDIIRASPRPLFQAIDAGFVSSVFDMSSYKLGRETADGRRAVPDYANIIECTACQLSYESHIISGPISFKESLRSQVKPDTLLLGQPFETRYNYRAGEAYLKAVEETVIKKRVLVDTTASCVVYCAELRNPSKPVALDSAFVDAVRQLPVISTNSTDNSNSTSSNSSSLTVTCANMQPYFAFLQKFGTHVVSSMRAGSLFWQRATFSQVSFTRVELDTPGLGLGSAAGFAFLNATFNYQMPQELVTAEKFKRSASSIVHYSLGAFPLSKQGPYNTTMQWLQESRLNPMPVEFNLMPITSLFTNESFPDEDADEIALKRTTLEGMVQNGTYCCYLNLFNPKVSCGSETSDDLLAPEEAIVLTNFGGTYYKADTFGIKDVANQLNGIFDCPSGFNPILVGGGNYNVEKWPGPGNCYPDGSSVAINQQILLNPTLPGRFYVCRNGTYDQQNSFHGFFSLVNAPCYGTYQHWQCASQLTCCGGICKRPASTGRDGRSLPLGGDHDILVAFYGCEYIYASYTRTPGAFIGGFYLIDLTRPKNSWVNPVTGVTSCPAGYSPKLLFAQTNANENINIYPFESYVCIIDTSV